jgi:hypothetical protein
VLSGTGAAAFGPADDRGQTQPQVTQVLALLAGRELKVGLGPSPRPVVLVAVESRRGGPVVLRELERIVDAQSALLGGVDEEESAEGPERLPAEVGPVLLVEDEHALAVLSEFVSGDEPGET